MPPDVPQALLRRQRAASWQAGILCGLRARRRLPLGDVAPPQAGSDSEVKQPCSPASPCSNNGGICPPTSLNHTHLRR